MSVPTSEHFSNSCYTALRIIDTIVGVKSWFIVVLICISLMTNNAEYLFTWVRATGITPLEKHLFRSFTNFLVRSFVFLLLSCKMSSVRLWPPDVKNWLTEKDHDAEKDQRRGERGRQRMRWLDGITDSMYWVWTSSESWWWTGKPGMLQPMELQRVGHAWVTELNWRHLCLFWIQVRCQMIICKYFLPSYGLSSLFRCLLKCKCF